MARPPLWTIRDPQVRAIVGANRRNEEAEERAASIPPVKPKRVAKPKPKPTRKTKEPR